MMASQNQTAEATTVASRGTLSMEECARDAIARHAEEGYPDEICGILLGREKDGHRTIQRTMPVENSFDDGERYHRFLITPKAMLAAERLARYDGMDVLGVYHSHPNAPARPSEYDRDHAAWTTWTYVIASVHDGSMADLKAWRLLDDRSGFEEVEIEA